MKATQNISNNNNKEPKQPISTISAEVSLPINSLEKFINHHFPQGYVMYERNMGQLGFGPIFRYKSLVKLSKYDYMYMKVANDKLLLKFPVQTQVYISYDGNLPAPTDPIKITAKAELIAEIKLYVSDNWNLTAKTSLEKFQWTQSPEFEIIGIPIKTLQLLEREIERVLVLWLPNIDELLSEQNYFKSTINWIWELIHLPIEIQQNPNLWLQFTAHEVATSSILKKKGQLYALLTVKGWLNTYFNDTAIPQPLDALPLATSLENYGKQFRVQFICPISYQQLSNIITDALQEQSFSLLNDWYKISIPQVTLGLKNDKLLCEAQFTGSMTGQAFMECKPIYYNNQKQLQLEQFTVQLNTSNVLLNAFQTLGKQSFQTLIRDTIQEQINDLLNDISTFSEDFLRQQEISDYLSLLGSITQSGIDSINFDEAGINTIIFVAGKQLGISINLLPEQ